MTDHDCPGDDCVVCEARIAAREWERDVPEDYPDALDWNWPIGRSA